MNQNIPEYQTGWTSEDEFNDARPNNNGRFADVRVLRARPDLDLQRGDDPGRPPR